MKDIRGNELEVGAQVAINGMAEIYTGVITRIRDNNGKNREWYTEYYGDTGKGKEHLRDTENRYTVLRDKCGKPITIDSAKRMLVLQSPKKRV